jgi:WD40 repeat protein
VLSSDGKHLYSGSGDLIRNTPGEIKVWNLEMGKETLTLRGHSQPVTSLVLSSDGKHLYSGSGQFDKLGEIRVWDLEGGKETLTLRGYTNWVTSLVLSSDGKRLFSGSGQFNTPGEITIWNLEAAQETLTQEGAHPAGVRRLVLSSEDQRLKGKEGLRDLHSSTASGSHYFP